jgi:hypothetical protein
MASTKWNSDVKQLFRETVIRYPHQKLEPETEKAYLQDWRDECDRVGFARFSEGVKGARAYSEFFPMIAKICKFIPEPRNENLELRREMADLQRRKAGGEKFYTLADVLVEFSKRVESGQIKGRDEYFQKRLDEWVKLLRGSEKRYAALMLAAAQEQEEIKAKRPKSDFQSAHDAMLKTKTGKP